MILFNKFTTLRDNLFVDVFLFKCLPPNFEEFSKLYAMGVTIQ